MPRIGMAASKARCWSAHSSGVQTVASSYDSPFSHYSLSGMLNDELTLSQLRTDGDSFDLPRPTVADAATRPNGLSPVMMDAVIRLAEQTGTKLVEEAQAAPQTRTQRDTVKLLSLAHGIELYESLPLVPLPPPPPPPPVRRPSAAMPRASLKVNEKKKVSFSRALWNRLTKRRRRPLAKGRSSSIARQAPSDPTPSRPLTPALDDHVPRLVGLTQVHVPLDELLDVVGHRSIHATTLLHPGMTPTGVHHSLIDLVDEHVCLRSMTLDTPTHDPRDFLFVEYHHAFKTRTGRRGFSIAHHSVHWTRCPSPMVGAVRGSMYESGLVAIESKNDPDCVDLYCVAELNLKGDATTAENLAASRARVSETLGRITQTIEERAKMLLSLDHTHVFQQARRATAQKRPVCADCKGLIRQLPPKTEPYACRKCYIKVCEDCSSMWQRGHKEMRLCMECWADATLNRTCVREQGESFMFL